MVVGIVGTAAGGLIGARAWLTTSPRFAVDHIEVRGAELTPRAAIDARLEAGDRPNIFRFDTTAAQLRLEASPWIRQASISRALPDGLVVEISEHQPAALVVAGDLYLADEAGALFKRASADEAVELDLIAVTGLSREAIAADSAATSELVHRAIELARHWHESKRPTLGEVNVDPVRGFTLITTGRAIAVRVGASTDAGLDARLALFDRAWAALDSEQREAVATVHLDQSASPRRATVAFERQIETSAWAN